MLHCLYHLYGEAIQTLLLQLELRSWSEERGSEESSSLTASNLTHIRFKTFLHKYNLWQEIFGWQ